MSTAATATGRADRRSLVGLLLAALLAPGAAAAADEVEVTASHEGFRPRIVQARRGETLRLLLSTADDEHCFAIDAFRVEKRILPGKTTILDLTPDQAGTFPFYCCLESGRAADLERGRLVVTD